MYGITSVRKIYSNIRTYHKPRGVRHGKSCHVLYCMVLPPGEFNGKISEPLPVYSESFTNRFPAMLPRNKVTKMSDGKLTGEENVSRGDVRMRNRRLTVRRLLSR